MGNFIELRVFIALDGDFVMWEPQHRGYDRVIRPVLAPGDSFFNKEYNLFRLRVGCSIPEQEAYRMAANPDFVRELIRNLERGGKAPWKTILP
jgi:hypothetical protein